MRRHAFSRSVHQLGFSLIELMISIVIGLLIVMALVTVLINVNRTNGEMGKTNRLIESGRYAMQLLENDIEHAGFWSGYVPQFDDLVVTTVPTDYPAAVPDPCLAFSTPWTAAQKNALVGIAVQGYEIPAAVPSPTLSVCASKVLSPKASTDVLFVRHTEQCTPGSGACAALKENALYFQVARCGTVTPVPAYALEKYVAANAATLFPLQNRDCTTTADLRKFNSTLYYIRDYAVTSGDGIPTLMRSTFDVTGTTPEHKDAEVLIDGIEGFRVEYGVDSISDSGAAVNFGAVIAWANANNKTSPTNRGDGVPDGAYVRCTTATPCTAAKLANVVAVKIYILARSDVATTGYTDDKTYALGSTTLGPFNDGFKRHLFSQTMRLTNVAARRETP